MKPKILFFGTPDIAVPSLQTIAELPDYEIVGVGVFPDRKVGRKQILTPCPVKVAAESLDLPILEIESKADLEAAFKEHPCDLALVIAFGMIFPKTVLNQPRLGVVNVHFSLLPAFRGASPVQAAILAGLEESGITWQKMVPALDAGDRLWQTTHSIKDQTTATVWREFAQYTADSFPAFLEQFTQGNLDATPQDQNLATYCGKFEKADGYLNPKNQTATTILRAWRAFQPWPGVNLETESGQLKLIDVSTEASATSAPLICAEHTVLHVETVQRPSKNPQAFQAFLKKYPNWF